MIFGISKNVVVVKNISSDTVEQAILILKKDPEDVHFYASEDGIVCEAQKIIDAYHARSDEHAKLLPVLMILGALLAGIAIFFLLRT